VDKDWLEKMIAWVSTTQEKDELLVKQELKTWVEEYAQDTSPR
jgi:hypothetical protein